LLTLEDAIDIEGRLAELVVYVHSIREEATRIDILAALKGRRQSRRLRKRRDPLAVFDDRGVWDHHYATHTLPAYLSPFAVELIGGLSVDDLSLHVQFTDSVLGLPKKDGHARIVGVANHADAFHAGNQFGKQFHQLGTEIDRNVAEASDIASRSRQTGGESRSNRVSDSYHDDGNCGRCAASRIHRRRGPCDDDINIAVNKLSHGTGIVLECSLRPANVDGQ